MFTFLVGGEAHRTKIEGTTPKSHCEDIKWHTCVCVNKCAVIESNILAFLSLSYNKMKEKCCDIHVVSIETNYKIFMQTITSNFCVGKQDRNPFIQNSTIFFKKRRVSISS